MTGRQKIIQLRKDNDQSKRENRKVPYFFEFFSCKEYGSRTLYTE